MKNKIYFSVLMSVYANEKPENLNVALSSIWLSQSVKPNQIVLVCDGSLTTSLYSIIDLWKQKLNNIFLVIQLNHNSGLAIALNEGLKYCKYEYVARMDSDDIASPDRFEKQFNYLYKHPKTTLLGTNVLEFKYEISNIINKKYVPNTHQDFSQFIKCRNPINHMTVVFKKSDILKVGGYTVINGYEDYLLWVKLFVNGFILENLNESLVFARIDNGFILKRKGYRLFKNEIILQFKFYKLGLFGLNIFLFNLIFRSISRLLPTHFLKFLYYKLRNE